MSWHPIPSHPMPLTRCCSLSVCKAGVSPHARWMDLGLIVRSHALVVQMGACAVGWVWVGGGMCGCFHKFMRFNFGVIFIRKGNFYVFGVELPGRFVYYWENCSVSIFVFIVVVIAGGLCRSWLFY